jgi:hypothetical protein
MQDLEYWTKALRQAEAALEAATRRSDVDAAARRLMRAKAELKALKKAPKIRARRGAASDPSPA